MNEDIAGGCLCGRVRYRLLEAPTHVCDCHCIDCRRASGAPFITWGIVKRGSLEVLSGEVRKVLFAGRIRMFAACCGTQLFFLDDEGAASTDVTIASLDSPGDHPPQITVWTEDRLPWVHLDASRAAFRRRPGDAALNLAASGADEGRGQPRPLAPVMDTPRLSLREITSGDGGFIFALMNEPAYLQHIGDRGVRTLDDARRYILEKLAPSYAKVGYGLYLVELKEGRVPVGICGLVRREALEHPDIGFAFLHVHWSRGLAFEAAGATLDHAFGSLGLKTVLGITSPANQASIRLLEKLGLKFQRMIRLPSHDRDTMLFSTEGGRA